MKKPVIAAIALGALMSASGATVSYQDFFGVSLTDFTETVTLPKFDSTLGTLIGVKYTLSASIDGAAQFDSENPQPSNVTVQVGGEVSLKDGATTLILLAPSISSGPIPVTGDSDAFFPDFVGSDSGTFAGVAAGSDSVIVNAVDFPAFIGNAGDTFTWDVDAVGDSSATGSANLLVFINQVAGGDVTVEYTYTNLVPETSTYLSALGLVGVAALAGRRLVRR